jgi:hypothetical protein
MPEKRAYLRLRFIRIALLWRTAAAPSPETMLTWTTLTPYRDLREAHERNGCDLSQGEESGDE